MEGAQLSIDLTGKMGSDDDDAALTGAWRPSILPQIRIRNTSIRMKGTGYETRFDNILLTTHSIQPGESRLQLRVAQWSLNHPDLRNIAASIETDMSYSHENLMIEKLLVDNQLIVKSATIGLGRLGDSARMD